MFVASVYGPTHTTTFIDPWAILSKLCAEVFDHALAFKGPAVVMGDFNVVIEDLPRWNAMKAAGWVDAAQFDATRRQCQPQPTSKDKARKSFILINPMLVQAMQWCGTIEEYEFDAHPLLAADFDVEVMSRPVEKWWLPVTTDQYLFDHDLLHESASKQTELLRDKFQTALERRDGDEAFRQFNLAFENCLKDSCVDTVGQSVVLPRRCFGRGRKRLSRLVHPSAPVVRHARDGHFNPDTCQPSAVIRNMTKQVRRLQSLESQVTSAQRCGSHAAVESCRLVWNAALSAKGFFPNFQIFVLNTFGIFVPMSCPGVEYIHYLVQVLKSHLQAVIADTNKSQRFARECRMMRDVQKGGAEAYKSVRDNAAPPFHAIVKETTAKVTRQIWPKEGRASVRVYQDPGGFDFQFPVYFQDQECFVTKVEGPIWFLDRPVKWRSTDDWNIKQRRVIADHKEMQQLTGQAWSEMWRREPENDVIENWPDVLSSLQSLPDFPTMQVQPLTPEMWRSNARSVAKKSARGCCAYTARELLLMPDNLVYWLLSILSAIEDGHIQWPRAMMVARVVMLGKSEDQPTCPLQTRPITIASRIYRNWARCRSLQILQHLQSLLPAQVAGSAAGVSADLLAAKVMFEVEQAILHHKPRLGLTIDLKKCFNQVPRVPIMQAMRKLGIPVQYITALGSMFQGLRRVIELAGEVGDEWSSTTGVPEGCAMSLVSMLTLTAWAAGHIQEEVQSQMVECMAYADNWGILTNTMKKLQDSSEALFRFVQMLRMQIATDKSWTWSTDANIRSLLKDFHVQGLPIPTKLVAGDLGCDMSYCKKPSKKMTRNRIRKASRVLGRVGSKRLPKRFKSRMAAQLSTSIPGYGSELVYHTPSELRTIRSATCRALGRARSGNNPYLSTLVVENVEDIALNLLRRKVNFR
eukprot:s505_g17.t1